MRIALSHPAHRQTRDLWSRLSDAITLHRSRRSLLTLDAHLLSDIGLSRTAALNEAHRPIWDAPQTWRS